MKEGGDLRMLGAQTGCLAMQGGRMHVVPAVRQGHSLTLTFQLPSLFKEYRAKPDDYVQPPAGP